MNSAYLVKTESCYAAICDEGSPVNRLGFMDIELESAKKLALQEGMEDFFSLFIFNDRLMHAASQGALLSWTLLFDGVFRAEAQVTPQLQAQATETGHLGSSVFAGTLACPTGRLIVTCLSRLGELHQPIIEVEPGVYQVVVERDEDAEFEHSHIESLARYPVGLDPDWSIKLSRVGSV